MRTNARAPFTIVGITLTVLASFVTACTFDDDPVPSAEDSETDGSAALAECQADVQQAQGMCMPPEQVFWSFDEDLSLIPVDDPEARIPIGPNGWLVLVPSANHYAGSQHFDGGSCSVGCGWCQPGQSPCHGEPDEDGNSCTLCLPWDTVDPEAQCTVLVEACAGVGEGGDETGSGDTGPNGGSDEPSSSTTGSGDTGDDASSSSTTSSGDTGSDGGSGEPSSSTTGSGDTGADAGLDETGS